MQRTTQFARSGALLLQLITLALLIACASAEPPPFLVPDTLDGEVPPRAGGMSEIPPLYPRHRTFVSPEDTLRERGLEFRLREGIPEPATPPRTPATTNGAPLTAAETAALLRRLPPLDAAIRPADGFLFPAASPPPPRTGALVLAPFPPADTAEAPPAPGRDPATPAALQVVRIVPTGEVNDLAPHLTLVFSEPMVPLSSVAEVHARAAPVRLSPQPPGRWQWVDTRTLRFEPEPRFPMATRFTVEVPAGTRSATGAVLAEAVRSEFSTPAPRAIGGYPHRQLVRRVELEPLILLIFDQQVEPAAVLRGIEIRAGGRAFHARAATPREIAADSVVRALVEDAPEGRWVALRPAQPLPRESEVRVVVPSGTPSSEGGLTTAGRQELPLRTYGPLRVETHQCGGGPEHCWPGAPWQIRFTNPLDERAWSDDLVRVEPEVPELRIQLVGENLVLQGETRPRTTYRVTLDGRIRDHFGQQLGAPRTLTITVGDHPPMLQLPGAPLAVLDPGGPPQLPVLSRGMETMNVRLYRVRPEDWPAFSAAVRRHLESRMERPLQPPGERVASFTLRPVAGLAGLSETRIDLSPALPGGLGHAIVVIEPEADPRRERDPRRMYGYGPGVPFAWVQATRIGLSAAVDNLEALGWTTSLETGEPLAGVELRLLPSGTRATTDRTGLAVLPLSPQGDAVLTARRGDDVALLPDREPMYFERGGRGSWRRQPQSSELRWYLFTDRGLYRPGEGVRLKGWMRRVEGGRNGGPALPHVERVGYTLTGPRGEELGRGETQPGALGGLHFAFELPEALNLGYGSVQLEARGGDVPQAGRRASHQFMVQEFRRPEYEVRLETDPGPHVIGATLASTLHASYYGGGGLPDTEVEWRVHSRPAHFTPAGWEGWSFGRQPWGWMPGRRPEAGPRHEQLTARTDARGMHRLLVELLSVDPPFPTMLRAEAEVRDVNRQAGSAFTEQIVHPALAYVGLRLERGWVRPGDTLAVRVVAVDPEGAALPGRTVRVRAERIAWRPRAGGGSWETVEEIASCEVLSAADPVRCAFATTAGGTLRISAEVRDEAGRPSRTELTAWVAGGPPLPPTPDRPAAGEVGLVPDRQEYQPGQVAEILVQPPFHPAEATLTLRHGGILSSERFRIEGETHVLRIPLTEAHIPNVQVHLELVDAAGGLRFARGQVDLRVPPRRRELQVRVLPRDSVLEPGGQTALEVEVRRADGTPAAGAEVALWMVDEAVLALGSYRLPDPLETFYPVRHAAVMDHQLRARVLLAPRSAGPGTLSGIVLSGAHGMPMRGLQATLAGTDLGAITGERGEFTLRGVPPGRYTLRVTGIGYGGLERAVVVPAEGLHLGTLFLQGEVVQLEGMVVTGAQARAGIPPPAAPPPPMPGERLLIRPRDGGDAADLAPGTQKALGDVELRADFAPLAFFEPSLRTDANGRVHVPARLPGSLTRYRVMAVAVEGATLYGKGESTVSARRELMARPSLPRFLNFGDRVEIPVVVQNLAAAPLEVQVALRADGLEIEGSGGRRVTVPAGDRVELRFPALAHRAGQASVQVVAAAGNLSDAAALRIPVYTPATTEAFATYGEVDTGAPVVLPVQLPGGVIEGFGGLEVTTSSTALAQLTDAMLYLHSYPFEGAEPLASRILAVAALREVLAAFAAEGLPPPEEIASATARDLRTLIGLQNHDGGWSFWRPGMPSDPLVSIHVLHALQRARMKAFAVPDEPFQRAYMYVHEIERQLWQPRDGHRLGDARTRNALLAYAFYVRRRIGDSVGSVSDARRLLRSARPEDLTVEAMGWLLHTLALEAPARGDVAELLRRIQNRATETAAAATFATSYGEGEHLLLHSSRRSDAVVLEALIAADPGSDLIPKVARGLLAHRVQGRWRTTQENVWVLLALERYFNTYERTTPDFRARIWLGERYAGGHAFRGRTTERHHLEIPTRAVAANGASGTASGSSGAGQQLLLAREGEGRMYYRAALRYAPADLVLDPAQRGFLVERSYEAVDDPADVRRDADGTWRIRAGARVRVRISMTAPSRRYHIALVDPLPAGLEPLNPELAGTGFTDAPEPPPPPMPRPMRPDVAPARLADPGWRGRWYVHQNLRDDRAEAFATLLGAGSYEYSYLARATAPGRFIVPPPRAEEMYHPETFGRGASDRVVVEAGGR